jgi:hypothetical protein
MGIFWDLSGKGAEWMERNNLCRYEEKTKKHIWKKVRMEEGFVEVQSNHLI